MKSRRAARVALVMKGGVTLSSSANGDAIEVDKVVFVNTVLRLARFVYANQSSEGRVVVRNLHQLCRDYNSGARGVVCQELNLVNALAGFVDYDGFNLTLKVTDPNECRIMLDALDCPNFFSAPRMNPTILSRALELEEILNQVAAEEPQNQDSADKLVEQIDEFAYAI